MSAGQSVADALREKAARARADAAEVSRLANRVAIARLLATAGFLILGAGAVSNPSRRTVIGLATAATVVIFALLVRWTTRLTTRRRDALGRATVAEQGAHRADRGWSHILPQPWAWPADGDETLRVDLDVTGSASLVQLLPMISAGIGAPRMRAWLSAIASLTEIRERQASVRELVDAVALRDTFELYAHRVRVSEAQVATFIAWGRADALEEPLWLAIASRLLPAVSIVGIVLSVVWPDVAPVATSIVLLSVFATFILTTLVRSRTREAVRAAEVADQLAEAYAELGAHTVRAPFDTPRLRVLQMMLGHGQAASVDRALNQLRGLSRWAEVRSSPMLHAALQGLFAWDCHIARGIEGWRATHGATLGDWFDAFAEVECLAALAGLAATNPSWTFPELIVESPFHVRARALAHPLLPTDIRVANDVDIGPPGTLLLISGSNMSGKSTLLRAIGLNLLLARVGAPVCAGEMSCAPVRLMTSLRVQDSLADGMSYFMAEALRLRDIIAAAESSGAPGASPVVYLVDEILRGTNSEERAVAARFIVARLLQTPAIGIITTHDLGIFNVADISNHVRHAHFAEKFSEHPDGERLVFDHRLRDGPTTSTNALRLLALIGITPATTNDREIH